VIQYTENELFQDTIEKAAALSNQEKEIIK
jgi:hypothetical protein